jgi:hypothetical protein
MNEIIVIYSILFVGPSIIGFFFVLFVCLCFFFFVFLFFSFIIYSFDNILLINSYMTHHQINGLTGCGRWMGGDVVVMQVVHAMCDYAWDDGDGIRTKHYSISREGSYNCWQI